MLIAAVPIGLKIVVGPEVEFEKRFPEIAAKVLSFQKPR
jgi:hypothetical protein